MIKKVFFSLLVSFNVLHAQEKEKITFEKLAFSTAHHDNAPSIYKDGFLFVSDRGQASPFSRLYYSDFASITKKIKIKNATYHIGPAYYDQKNDLIYLTKSNTQINANHESKLAIYKGKMEDFKISKLKKLPFCNPEFSYAYASLFKNNLYISTDEFGSYAVVSYQLQDDKWINPQIIFTDDFPIINPVIMDENTLYFASKRKGGLGGIDLYKIEKNEQVWSAPINLTAFNSPFDDLSILFINPKEGYISSNRLDKTDHIFKFKIE